MKHEIILRGRYPVDRLEELRAAFTVHFFMQAEAFEPAIAELAPRLRVIVTNGGFGLTGDQMRRFPKLERVIIRGTGTENVDLATARELGLSVTSGEGVNAFSVADHAMALLLTVMRGIKGGDIAARETDWNRYKASRPSPPVLYGKRVGILGLGGIGAHIARRVSGFDAAVFYHGRTRQADVPYQYMPSVLELAEAVDVLMIALPGGAATRHLVDRAVLEVLGPSGFLVNVGRGSVVDTVALVEALRDGRIAGAGLDVLEGEPAVPDFVREAPNLILTPHMAANSPEAEAAMHNRVLTTLTAHFADVPVS